MFSCLTFIDTSHILPLHFYMGSYKYLRNVVELSFAYPIVKNLFNVMTLWGRKCRCNGSSWEQKERISLWIKWFRPEPDPWNGSWFLPKADTGKGDRRGSVLHSWRWWLPTVPSVSALWSAAAYTSAVPGPFSWPENSSHKTDPWLNLTRYSLWEL